MREILFNINGKNYLKYSRNIDTEYCVFNHDENYIPGEILVFSNSFGTTISFINFSSRKKQVTINEEDLLYPAFDKLLGADNNLEIINDEVKRTYNSKITIKRKNNKFVIDISKLPKKSFSSIHIQNLELKERFVLFFKELDDSYNDGFEQGKFKCYELKKVE